MLICYGGKNNPANLGTKSLTRDKIRKYMTTICYIGEYLDMVEGQEMVEVEGEVRMARGRRVDEERIRRIIQAVTMAVLVGLGEAVEGEERKDQGPSCVMYMVMSMVVTGSDSARSASPSDHEHFPETNICRSYFSQEKGSKKIER